jgi:hypothetical protein
VLRAVGVINRLAPGLARRRVQGLSRGLGGAALFEILNVTPVVGRLAADPGLDAGGLDRLRSVKAVKRRSFTERIVWCGNLGSRPLLAMPPQEVIASYRRQLLRRCR